MGQIEIIITRHGYRSGVTAIATLTVDVANKAEMRSATAAALAQHAGALDGCHLLDRPLLTATVGYRRGDRFVHLCTRLAA